MSDLKRRLCGLRCRWILSFAAVLAMAAFANATAAQKIELKIGAVTIRDTGHQWMIYFEKNVEDRIGDKVDVRIFPGGQLGTGPRQVEGVQLGTQEMFMIPPAFLVGIDKRFMVTSAPGVFTSLRHAQKTLHHPNMKEQLFTTGEPKGIKVIGLYAADEHYVVSKRPIRTLADFHGKKIRVRASAMEREVIRRLGGSPAPIPLLETLPALQRGVIDSMVGGVGILVAFKYWTAAKYLTVTNDSVVTVMALASQTWWEKLPAEIRTVLLEEAERTDWQTLEFAEQFKTRNLGLWQENGGELIELTSADQAQMHRMLSSVGDAVVTDEPNVKKLFDEMKTIAAQTPDN